MCTCIVNYVFINCYFLIVIYKLLILDSWLHKCFVCIICMCVPVCVCVCVCIYRSISISISISLLSFITLTMNISSETSAQMDATGFLHTCTWRGHGASLIKLSPSISPSGLVFTNNTGPLMWHVSVNRRHTYSIVGQETAHRISIATSTRPDSTGAIVCVRWRNVCMKGGRGL